MLDVVFKKRKIKKAVLPIKAFAFRVISRIPRSAGVMDMPEIPEDFEPVMRFVMASDVHIGDEKKVAERERLVKMIKRSYEIAGSDSKYNKLDAICFAGDISDSGKEESFKEIRELCGKYIKDDTQLLVAMGNHDFKTIYEGSRELFSKYFECGTEFDRVINGFHVIGVSETGNGRKGYGKSVQEWLEEHLKKANEEDPKKPIFVYQHEHITNTVYGSMYWGDNSLTHILKKYPQVIDFSGHSHYPINDPRSIWQGSFTALGTGTLSYFELEADGTCGLFPEEKERAAQMYVVETDANGSVLIRSYDLLSDSFFGETRYIKTPWDKSTFAYNVKNRMSKSGKPYFDAKSVLMPKNMPDGTVTLSFPSAHDNDIVSNYRIEIKDEKGNYVYEDLLFSDYYFNPEPEIHIAKIEKLESGKRYTAFVAAENAYGRRSKQLKASFTVK